MEVMILLSGLARCVEKESMGEDVGRKSDCPELMQRRLPAL